MGDTDDRYPPPPDGEGGEWQRWIEQRLSELEGQRFVGSNFTSREGGIDRAIVGKLDDAGTHYGMRVPAVGGTSDAFYVDERGLDTPQFMVPTAFYGDAVPPYLTIAGGGWTLVGRVVLPPIVSQPALRMILGYSVAGGSTINFNITSNSWVAAGFIAETNSPAITGGGGSQQTCDWLHQIPLGVPLAGADYYFVDVYARIFSGGGTGLAYQPWFSFMNEDHGATLGGLWQAV